MPQATGAGGLVLEPATPVVITIPYSSPVDGVHFIASRSYRVHKVIARPTASAAGATGVVKKVDSGTAITSGTAVHTSNFTLDGTAHTNQTMVLSATSADCNIAAGQAIGIDWTGTTTSGTGVVMIELIPTS